MGFMDSMSSVILHSLIIPGVKSMTSSAQTSLHQKPHFSSAAFSASPHSPALNPPCPGSAFVTGASGEIGSAIARALAQKGYQLTLLGYHSKEALQNLTEELRSASKNKDSAIRVLPLLGDIADPAFVEEAARRHFEQYGSIDLIVNNAGIAHLGLITDMSVGDWQRLMDVNVNALFYTSKFLVPSMIRAQKGQIVNISSMWGRVGASCEVAYSASKGAVNAFTMALAKELAPSHIQVNALACGMIDTRMNAMLSQEDKAAIVRDIPADRMGTAQDVARALIALLDSGDYLTGQVIGLDGGYI